MGLLTDREMRALSADDAHAARRLREPGNLVGKVRLNRAGKVVVGFEYRYRAGTRVRSISCGTWPEDSLAAIRRQRDAFRVDVDRGTDPIEVRRTAELAAKAEQAEAHHAARARLEAVAAATARMTVSDLFDRWERLALADRKDGGAEVRRMFEKDILPTIGGMAVEDVKKRHVAATLDKVRERGVGRMVGLLLSLVRQMFRFAVARDWIEADPTAALRKADFGGKTVERERTLSEDEIRELKSKLTAANLSPSTEAALWIMLSTCCRVGELTKARWADIDTEAGRWLIPPENAKNKRAHLIALSDFAARQFAALRLLEPASAWVLPASRRNAARRARNADEETHVDEKSISKQVRDRQRHVPMKGRSKCSSTLLLTGGDWTPHDLRRTGATLMGELGVDGDVIERCLNHVEPNRMKRTYQRQRTEEAKAQAWRLLGVRLALLTSNEGNVRTLQGKRTAAA